MDHFDLTVSGVEQPEATVDWFEEYTVTEVSADHLWFVELQPLVQMREKVFSPGNHPSGL